MVTIDTVLDDLAAGCSDAETYTDVEVLKSRLELGDQGAEDNPAVPVEF
jgi:hypothetical protein